MNLIKPAKLKKGDTIAIIAPCGDVDREKLEQAVRYFEKKGFKVKLGSNIYKTDRYLAGNDDVRLEDLHKAFLDKETKAIICARGGYGALRLIDNIDYSIIKNNPKVFCGYSDVTALSAMILKNTGLVTFSGPMAQCDFCAPDKLTEDKFFETLTQGKTTITAENLVTYKGGTAEGVLFGGNLATLASLCGRDFLPKEDFIFFCEDLNESVYKIDKYFHQLTALTDFKKHVQGIILGDFLDVDNNDWLDELFKEIAAELDIPVFSGYPISHSSRKDTVPYGIKAKLTNGILTFDY